MNAVGIGKARSRAGIVSHVRPGSEAEALGLRHGDAIVAIDGQPLHDVLDYQYYAADGEVELLVERDGSRFTVQAEGDGPLGIEFADASFDGIRRCANHCLFCFVDQLPPSLRTSLYVKDDDFRYSALYGNFVTLTNWKEKDWRRVTEQHIGPLHVSVHCTDLAVRRHLLGNPGAPDILGQLRRLAEISVQVHAQVVLCPGINDGPILERTVTDLADLYPSVQTVGVVPVAVNSEHGGKEGSRDVPRRGGRLYPPAGPVGNLSTLPGLCPFDAENAAVVVGDVRRLQRECRERLGVGLVYLADELYLLAGEAVPPARSYDGFPQFENGIGMVRSLKDDWARLRRRLLKANDLPPRRVTAVCGRLIEPVLRGMLAQLAAATNWSVELVGVSNKLFEPAVTVSGLLSGNDVTDALLGRDLGDHLVLPRSMLDNGGNRFLDDITPGELEARLGRPVRFANDIKELVEAVART